MSQIIQKLDQQQLKSLCGIVAHTSEGLTKSELTTLLGQCGICAVDDGSSRNQLGYTIGLNKRDWLYNCLVTEINKSQSFSKVFSFLQAVLNPAAYTGADSRQKYRYLFEETNKVLLFAGLSIDQSGRLVAVSQAETLSEVDQRVNQLKKALYDRAIHSEVQKYCVEDYLRADYYDAVFEASKGLAERVRQISGLTTDGGTLFQAVFSKNDPLQKRPREKKQRYFPELTDAKDIAIYYANKLCKNGGAAIFANRTSTVLTAINRIIELRDRGCLLAEIKGNSDGKEMSRLAQLMSDYYGEQHPYTIACYLGVVPHYSNLPNGLRLAVEHACRNKALRLVVCTSTLAQGVNIPIKYLFMTSFMVARNSMRIRSFQNLMGRTARSGMYTEGSVIVTDPRLFDNKNNQKNGGNYKWNDCIKMFDDSAAEPCGSSILSLVQDIRIDYETRVIGAKVAQHIIDHYNEPDCFEQYVNKLTTALHKVS